MLEELEQLRHDKSRLIAQVLELAERINGHSCTCSGCREDERVANEYRDNILSNQEKGAL